MKVLILMLIICMMAMIPSYTAQTYDGLYTSGRFRVNWTDYQSYTVFELRTDITDVNNLYTAIGFSRDRSMGDDNVVYCTYSFANAPANSVFHGYNQQKNRPILLSQSIPSIGITNSFIRLENGKLVCSFQRAKSYSGVQNYFDLNNNNYYLLVATGKIDSSNLIQFHATNALASERIINFRTNSLYSSSPKLKVHGFLMAITLMYFAFTGIIFSR